MSTTAPQSNSHELLDTIETNDIKKSFIISGVIHFALFVLLTIKMYFYDPELLQYDNSVRVDIVALPDKVNPQEISQQQNQSEKTEPLPPAKTQPLATQKDAINLDSKKNKQKEALNKLKTLEALEKLKETPEAESRKTKVLKQYKGNILSAGTELTGISKLQQENYIGQIDKHIKTRWSLPEWLARKNYQTRIRLKIDSNGQILSREILKSSGSTDYDNTALDTIDRSAPFPEPPEKLSAVIAHQGIVIGFPD